MNYQYSLFAYIVIIFVSLCASWANNWNKIVLLSYRIQKTLN